MPFKIKNLYLSKVEAFLNKIVKSISKENLPYLYKRCYIFPTKRAALTFTKLLQENFRENNFLLPEIITIQDFITQYSTFIIQDNWYLIATLHQIQNELTKTNQTFESFFPWGKLILKDFDECDKYLIDAKQLYNILKEQKEIENINSISEETRKYIEQFIKTVSNNGKENTYKNKFLKTWSLLGDMYEAFHQKLKEQGFAYEGMAYREVYEKLENKTLRLPYSHIAFCGFNALSLCEEKIFKTIESQYETSFWWDADVYFLENKFNEAGNFMRHYQAIFNGENQHWIIDDAFKQTKNITITGLSSNVAQAAYVAQHIKDNPTKSTAIVLCDEQMLTPLLYTLDVSKVNITMGYPIAQSELYLLVEILLKFYCNARTGENRLDFYHIDVMALSRHPYFSKFIKNNARLQEIIPLFIPYIPKDILQDFIPSSLLFKPTESNTVLAKLLEFINTLHYTDNYFLPIKQTIVLVLQQLQLLILENNVAIELRMLPYIVKQYLSSTKIPFTTDSNANVQVMGFLETRIMDFEQLFILSMNDEYLPGTNKTNSFIPYNLRKGFGLPTFEQFDGINAYHFYRLLKRADTIHLLYNNQIGDDASEKSRFIRQIEHDFVSEKNTVVQQIAKLEEQFVATTNNVVVIEKTPTMTEKLRNQKFSPSALKVYITCPLQFYLKYVANISEPDEFAEEIDAAVFGQILHKVLELIYKPYIKLVLTNEQIKSFTDSTFIKEKIKAACVDLHLPKEITQGSNKLQLKVIERIVQKILWNDATEKNLTVLETEQKFIWNTFLLEDKTNATLQGTIDRVDKINDHAVRIIDYKTGKINLPKFPDSSNNEQLAEFIEKLFVYDKVDYSATFQGLLYALMYYKLHHCTEIYVGYHHAKNMKNGIAYLNDGQAIPIELLLLFEQRLSTLLSDIIYKEKYFIQSENSDAYAYSAYADIVGSN